jgi:hypothetical protein
MAVEIGRAAPFGHASLFPHQTRAARSADGETCLAGLLAIAAAARSGWAVGRKAPAGRNVGEIANHAGRWQNRARAGFRHRRDLRTSARRTITSRADVPAGGQGAQHEDQSAHRCKRVTRKGARQSRYRRSRGCLLMRAASPCSRPLRAVGCFPGSLLGLAEPQRRTTAAAAAPSFSWVEPFGGDGGSGFARR